MNIIFGIGFIFLTAVIAFLFYVTLKYRKRIDELAYENVELLIKNDQIKEKYAKSRGNFELSKLWNVQQMFNDEFFRNRFNIKLDDMDDITKVRHTKEFILHVFREVAEILNEVPFKMHKKYVYDNYQGLKEKILEECIDVQKFLWGIFNVWGISFIEFEQAFTNKSAVVKERYDNEYNKESKKK